MNTIWKAYHICSTLRCWVWYGHSDFVGGV